MALSPYVTGLKSIIAAALVVNRNALADAMTGGTFGRRRIFDQLGVLSNANDRLTWNASYNSGDGVHYNAAGNAALKAYALRVLPEIVA